MKLRRWLVVAILCGGATLLGWADSPSRAEPRAPDAIRWLQEYLQIDTTNPPEASRPDGDRRAAELLERYAREVGADSTRLYADRDPNGLERVSMAARFTAEAPSCGGTLVLMHHLDVVPAGEGWAAPPFSGRLHQGRLWGRGAIDIKSLGIAQLIAIGALRDAGRRLCRDLLVLAVADEEAGGRHGTLFLLEKHPELFAGVDAVLNEGGSNRVNDGRVVFWGIEVVQKRPLWLKVSAEGRGGHGSRYAPASATHQLVKGLARLLERKTAFRLSPAARLYFGRLAAIEGRDPEATLLGLEKTLATDEPALGPGAGQQVYFVDNLQVTEMDTGQGINVVAAKASAYLDVRLLPDTDADAYLAEIRAILGKELTVEVVLGAPNVPPSPLDHPLYRAMENLLGPRAPVLPSFLPGTTDSRYFRERGIAAYGFSPFAIEGRDLRGIHAVDEYIRPTEFLRGIETLRRLLESYAAAP